MNPHTRTQQTHPMIRLAARLNRALAESRAFCCAITACARVGGLGLAVAYLARTMMSLPEVIRTRSLMVADQKFDIRELRYQGRRVHFAESHLGMLREIFGRRVYDREMATRPFGTVIDLGASSGFFTLYAIDRERARYPGRSARITLMQVGNCACGFLEGRYRGLRI